MKRSKDNKRKPPSREKYERENPVVSFRAPKEIYGSLQVVKEKQGKSYLDIMKAGLGLYEVKVRAEEEVRREAYDEGFEEAANIACDAFLVTYPCSKCGKDITVDTEEEKKAIREFMINAGWSHSDCSNP